MDEKPTSVPYICYESTAARYENNMRKAIMIIIICICLLFATNAAWLITVRNMQHEYTQTVAAITTEVDSDG